MQIMLGNYLQTRSKRPQRKVYQKPSQGVRIQYNIQYKRHLDHVDAPFPKGSERLQRKTLILQRVSKKNGASGNGPFLLIKV